MFILKMNQAFLSTNYNIYPNPNDGLFNISLINPTGNISIEVYTSIGQLLYKQGDIDLATTIDISNYASGLYIVRMMRDNVIMGTEKIIKR